MSDFTVPDPVRRRRRRRQPNPVTRSIIAELELERLLLSAKIDKLETENRELKAKLQYIHDVARST